MRGAVQLSIGFIVTVVIAVVLLSLALTWLRGMFGGIGGLTEDLTQQAQAKLRESFRGGEINFAIWPSQWEVQKGGSVKLSAGILNNAEDGEDHYYVINVIPAQCPKNDCEKNKPEITFDKTKTKVAPGTEAFKYIEVSIPTRSDSGTYIFNVVACYDAGNGIENVPNSDECDTTHPNLWGNPQQLIISTK